MRRGIPTELFWEKLSQKKWIFQPAGISRWKSSPLKRLRARDWDLLIRSSLSFLFFFFFHIDDSRNNFLSFFFFFSISKIFHSQSTIFRLRFIFHVLMQLKFSCLIRKKKKRKNNVNDAIGISTRETTK